MRKFEAKKHRIQAEAVGPLGDVTASIRKSPPPLPRKLPLRVRDTVEPQRCGTAPTRRRHSNTLESVCGRASDFRAPVPCQRAIASGTITRQRKALKRDAVVCDALRRPTVVAPSPRTSTFLGGGGS